MRINKVLASFVLIVRCFESKKAVRVVGIIDGSNWQSREIWYCYQSHYYDWFNCTGIAVYRECGSSLTAMLILCSFIAIANIVGHCLR